MNNFIFDIKKLESRYYYSKNRFKAKKTLNYIFILAKKTYNLIN